MIWKKSSINASRSAWLIPERVSSIAHLNLTLLGLSAFARTKRFPSTFQLNPSCALTPKLSQSIISGSFFLESSAPTIAFCGISECTLGRIRKSFMSELFRHIGPDTDVPAGDIGVGGREVGYLFGQYKRLKDQFTGTLTGKGISWGGSLLRPEATGYGLCYFASKMLESRGLSFEGMKVNISGAGNVAQYTAQKAMRLGAKVQTLSDSDGFVYDPDGLDEEKMAFVFQLKNIRRGRISEYVTKYPSATYYKGERPWKIPCDIALPCATQNEIEASDAENIVKGGAVLLAEGANMPTTPDAVKILLEGGLLYAPGKASNAGGVAVSGLEMSQNSMRTAWTSEEVDRQLQRIMSDIHSACVKYGTLPDGTVDYVRGANTAGFIKVADAMMSQGLV
ncbi:MAG: glutamate dehydrogenase [Bacteroidales bacterium]|nr:glutamate dehydrogenase [Bacteroidales bacterium]